MRLKNSIASEFLEQNVDRSYNGSLSPLHVFVDLWIRSYFHGFPLAGQLLKQCTDFKWLLSWWSLSDAMEKCSYYFHDKLPVLYYFWWL